MITRSCCSQHGHGVMCTCVPYVCRHSKPIFLCQCESPSHQVCRLTWHMHCHSQPGPGRAIAGPDQKIVKNSAFPIIVNASNDSSGQPLADLNPPIPNLENLIFRLCHIVCSIDRNNFGSIRLAIYSFHSTLWYGEFGTLT
jgi:hypothetical protein